MWTKKHKIFFAALLLSKIPTLTKRQFKEYGFKADDFDNIVKLAADFKTGEILPDDKIPGCLQALKNLTENKLDKNTNFLMFSEYIGRLNAKALSYLCNNGLYIDSDGRTHLFLIAAKGTGEDAAQLLNADVKHCAVDKYGYTALTLACINNNGGVAAALLSHGANVNCKDREGVSPLHFAAQLGHAALFPLLIEVHRANVNIQSQTGKTPFCAAVFAGQYDCARILVKKYTCLVDLEDRDGETLLQDSCVEYNSYMTAKKIADAEIIFNRIAFLLEMGANANRVYFDKRSKTQFNYLVQAMFERIYRKTLHDLDYKLVELLAQYHFRFNDHVICDNISMLSFIVQSQDLRLAKCCKLANDEDCSIVELNSDRTDRVAYMFSPMSLSKEQKRVIAERLQPMFDEFIMAFYGELYQIVFNETSNSVEKPLLAITGADETPEKNEKVHIKHKEVKQILAKDILDLLVHYFADFDKYTKCNIPKWCKEITLEKLMLKSFESLEELKGRIQQWGKSTIRQLEAKQQTTEGRPEAVEPKLSIPRGEAPCLAVYEGSLKYSSRLMLDISDTCCVLLPFNIMSEVGLDVIFDAKRISEADHLKFERVMADPKISRNPNQPGIRFLTDSSYTCRVMINGREESKLIIAELKIADSPNRIGLYRLSQDGQGKMVLAFGPYVDSGYHDTRYQNIVFQAHALDLSEKFIIDLEKRLSSIVLPAPLVAPPVSLMFLSPPVAAVVVSDSRTSCNDAEKLKDIKIKK